MYRKINVWALFSGDYDLASVKKASSRLLPDIELIEYDSGIFRFLIQG